MIVAEIIDMQSSHIIQALEKSLIQLKNTGAPEKILARRMRKIEKFKKLLNDKSAYEKNFPGLMLEKVENYEKKTVRFMNNSTCRTIWITTATGIYAYLPSSGKLFHIGPSADKYKNNRGGEPDIEQR